MANGQPYRQARPAHQAGPNIALAAVLGIAFLLLAAGRILGLADATDNNGIEDDVKASWWLIEIGTLIVGAGIAFVGIFTRHIGNGVRAAYVIVGVLVMTSPNLNAVIGNLFGGFGF